MGHSRVESGLKLCSSADSLLILIRVGHSRVESGLKLRPEMQKPESRRDCVGHSRVESGLKLLGSYLVMPRTIVWDIAALKAD